MPTSANVVVLSFGCTTGCNIQIDVPINVNGIVFEADFAGQVIQAAGAPITVGAFGWRQSAGTFIGGSDSITINGPFVHSEENSFQHREHFS